MIWGALRDKLGKRLYSVNWKVWAFSILSSTWWSTTCAINQSKRKGVCNLLPRTLLEDRYIKSEGKFCSNKKLIFVTHPSKPLVYVMNARIVLFCSKSLVRHMNHVGKVGIDNSNEWSLTNYVSFLTRIRIVEGGSWRKRGLLFCQSHRWVYFLKEDSWFIRGRRYFVLPI